MIPKSFRSKPMYYLLVLILFISFSVLVFSVVTRCGETANQSSKEFDSSDHKLVPQTDTKFDPLKYLPAGASLSNPEKNVVFADLDGDGKQEVIIFYAILYGDKHQSD